MFRSVCSSELLSEGDTKDLLQVTGCSAELQRPGCDSGCLSERYRSITGECNNRSALTQTHTLWFNNSNNLSFFLFDICASAVFPSRLRKHPRRGAANIPYSRWLPPEYEDAWGTPRGWDPEHTYHNATLPPVRTLQRLHPPPCQPPRLQRVAVLSFQVRLVSQEVLFTHNGNISLDASLSHLLVEWGQWIDHDVVQTPQSPSTAAFRTGADCTRTCSQDTPCFPIEVQLTVL